MITANFAHHEAVRVEQIQILYFVCKTCGEPLPPARMEVGHCSECYPLSSYIRFVWFPGGMEGEMP